MSAKLCRHTKRKTLFGDGPPMLWYSEPVHGETIEYEYVAAWCPDCGALAVKKDQFQTKRLTWLKPGPATIAP